MPNLIDRTGQRFGMLLVTERGEDKKWPNSRPTPAWACKCDCGSIVTVPAVHLTSGRVKSCGCYNQMQRIERATKHGRYGSPEYRVWVGMIQRCTNPKHPAYPDYAGRGVSVCERWRAFENFLADMGERPTGMTLDRENNNGNYEPGNCRWATDTEQARNMRSNVLIPHEGELVTLAELAERTGLPYSMLQSRHINGWPVENMTLPRRKNQWA